MRGAASLVVRRTAALILASATSAAAQQQGSVQISSETQLVLGHQARRSTERTWEPDFGALWTQPGVRFRQLQLEVRASRRGDELHLGRTWFSLRDAKARGVTWSFEGGDLYTPPTAVDYRFSNISAPAITFTGGSVSARTTAASMQLVVGRSTAWRNIFGTDPDTLGQSLGLLRGSYQATPRLQVLARASRVRTTNLKEFSYTVDASDQAGGGMKFLVTPTFHLIADGAFVRYHAVGAPAPVRDYSYLAGAHLLLSRGWVQVNASRYSPGDMPVLNASLQDRSGIFSAGEYDLFRRLRVFGGWETLDTNIRPTGIAVGRPRPTTNRAFAGGRLQLAPRTSFSLRIEDGGRVTRPALFGSFASLFTSTSDTGSTTAELQTSAGRITAFGRYTRRESVDSAFTSATYTQHDSAAQLYVNLSRQTQVFGSATLTNNRLVDGTGNSYLQVSGGAQQQLFKPGMWLRLEGTTSRSQDFLSGLLVPREALSVGLNGQLARNTTIGLNIYADRAPVGFTGEAQAWLTRSTLRVIHSIPTGSVRVNNTNGTAARPARGTGTVSGSVFADWNANGQPDPGEEALAGIPVALGTTSAVTTGRDGQFSFLNVPSGLQQVRLDLNALPVDFDAGAGTDVSLELSRGETRRVSFGLLPLGGIQGRVFEDTNRNGELEPGEPPLEGAVVVLDGGQRSELARKGLFRFEAVRAGDHTIELLKDSLPEGAAIVGAPERPAPITREAPHTEFLFLVTIDKRPEVRKVFPARGGGLPSAAAAARSARPGASAGTSPALPAGPARAGSVTRVPAVATPDAASATPIAAGAYTIQVAALTDAEQARALEGALKRSGFDAYLLEPPAGAPDALHRIRVGKFQSRASAQRTVARLESQLGLKLWVTRAR